MVFPSEHDLPAPDPTRKPDSPPLPDELARTLAGLGPAGEAPARHHARSSVSRTSAVRFGTWAGGAALLLTIIFVAQNTGGVQISFLWMQGRMPLALVLLVASAAGAVIALSVASARAVHLRRPVRRSR